MMRRLLARQTLAAAYSSRHARRRCNRLLPQRFLSTAASDDLDPGPSSSSSGSLEAANPPPLLSDFSSPYDEEFLAPTFLDAPRERVDSDRARLCDVFGNEVRLFHPFAADARRVGLGDSWSEVLEAGAPKGLTVAELRQWKQEVMELHSIDLAVAEYRSKFAQTVATESLTPNQLLERKMAQREVLGAGWFQELASDVYQDLAYWVLRDPRTSGSSVLPRTIRRDGLLGHLVGHSIASPRNVALDAVGRLLGGEISEEQAMPASMAPLPQKTQSIPSKQQQKQQQQQPAQQQQQGHDLEQRRQWHRQRQEELMEPEAIEALLNARERLQALPMNAMPNDVRQAMLLLGEREADSKGERRKITKALRGLERRQQKQQRDLSSGVKRVSGGSPDAPAVGLGAGPVVETERSVLGNDVYLRWRSDTALMDTYEDLQRARLVTLSEQLATVTIGIITSRMMQPTRDGGEKLDAMCVAVMDAISVQYTRDVIERFRQQQLDVAMTNVAWAEDQEELLKAEAATAARTSGISEDLDEEVAARVLEAKRAAVMMKVRAKNRQKQVDKTRTFDIRQTQASAKAISREYKTNLRPPWDTAVKMQMGAYLIHRLMAHAKFRPAGDEMARAREQYWSMIEDARREHGLSSIDDEDGLDAESERVGRQRLDALMMEGNVGSAGGGAASTLEQLEHDDALFSSDGLLQETGDDGDGLDALFAPSEADPTDEEGSSTISGGDGSKGAAASGGMGGDVLEPWASSEAQSDLLRASGEELYGDDDYEGLGYDETGSAGMIPAFSVYSRRGPPAEIDGKATGRAVFAKDKIKQHTYIRPHPQLYDALVAGDMSQLRTRLEPEARPMLVPPLAWQKPDDDEMPAGGQLHVRTEFVRTTSHRHRAILRSMDSKDYQPVLDGLHALSRTEWVVNERVLRIIQYLWEAHPAGLPFLADSPSTVQFPNLPSPESTDPTDEAARQAREKKYSEDLAHAMHTQANLHSQRVSARLKLDVAADFVNEKFYFAHNLDFRGRTYAVGPHLQYLGDDLARGLLLFAKAKPLGDDGLYWLKVQLANLYGMDKLSLDDRVAWSERIVGEGTLRRVDEQPMSRAAMDWWCAADNPVQTLALCFELQAALDSDDPTTFESRASVHMDGSCNGLQHYAALGRDTRGAEQVNLVPKDRPADVYSGVRQLVEDKVALKASLPELTLAEIERLEAEGEDAKKLFQERERRRIAKLLDGKITRKVVKQTVMTSVYGVTKLGARQQILNRLMDVYAEGGFSDEVERSDLSSMAAYVADLTLSSLDESFSGATKSMAWLVQVAALVSKDSRMPIEWVTPLGWPVLQPYFRIKSRRVRTVFHNMTIKESQDLALETNNSRAPVMTSKQKSALPPNYVHSLDSSHMLMSAGRCAEEGLTFAAVHDSYWTHARDVATMNRILREEFVRLHEMTTLEGLLEQLKEKYSCCRGEGESCPGYKANGPCQYAEGCMRVRWEKLPDPPPSGDLDLEIVNASTYFFS